MGLTAVSTADLEFLKEYNAGVNGEDMVDYLLTLVAQQLKVNIATVSTMQTVCKRACNTTLSHACSVSLHHNLQSIADSCCCRDYLLQSIADSCCCRDKSACMRQGCPTACMCNSSRHTTVNLQLTCRRPLAST